MMRVLTPLLLALMLALTSQSMAVARGASAAAGQIVLCTGSGPMAVFVDAEGQPTGAPHICPDATLHVLVEGALPDFSAPDRILRFLGGQQFAATPVTLFAQVAPPTRGPPSAV